MPDVDHKGQTYEVKEVKAGHGQNTTPVPDKECSIKTSVKE
jgi:hypothetical protein